jgi:hypothetical protein
MTVHHLVHQLLVNKNGEFVLKVLDADIKKRVREGYVLHVANQTETHFN